MLNLVINLYVLPGTEDIQPIFQELFERKNQVTCCDNYPYS